MLWQSELTETLSKFKKIKNKKRLIKIKRGEIALAQQLPVLARGCWTSRGAGEGYAWPRPLYHEKTTSRTRTAIMQEDWGTEPGPQSAVRQARTVPPNRSLGARGRA